MRSIILTVVLASSAVLPAAAADSIDAVWQEREVDFTFIGLDVAYSCELLQARVEMLLRHVGADDVHVTIPSCGAFVAPRRQLRVLARFATLVAAGEGEAGPVKAEWTGVKLGNRHPRSIDDHDCELLEQFQEYVLPEIEHRVIDGETGCGAARKSVVGTLRLEVLAPAGDDGAPAADGEPKGTGP